jgi:hypothetical protein
MAMDTKKESGSATTPASTLKVCPFCGDRAAVFQGDDQRFGVKCVGCGASTARINKTAEVAAMWWQLRLGTPSSLGGAATKGVTTPKKAQSSRRNLEMARAAKKLKLARTTTPALETTIRTGHELEVAKVQGGRAPGDPVIAQSNHRF